MEEYEFSIIHRPDTKHGNTDDMFMRPLCQNARCCPSGGQISNSDQEHKVGTSDEHGLTAAVRLSTDTTRDDQYNRIADDEEKDIADINRFGSCHGLAEI